MKQLTKTKHTLKVASMSMKLRGRCLVATSSTSKLDVGREGRDCAIIVKMSESNTFSELRNKSD